MRLRSGLIITASVLFCGLPTVAVADCSKPSPIIFKKKSEAATLSGGITRGEDICYTLNARGGQNLNVTVKSPDKNVVVTIYQPGYTIKPATGGLDFSGQFLPDATNKDEARSVHLKLPATGYYLFVLGTSRGGGGEYHMQVSVR